MKVSALIAELQEILDNRGDLPVRVRDNDSDWVLPVIGVTEDRGRVFVWDTGYDNERAHEELIKEGGVQK